MRATPRFSEVYRFRVSRLLRLVVESRFRAHASRDFRGRAPTSDGLKLSGFSDDDGKGFVFVDPGDLERTLGRLLSREIQARPDGHDLLRRHKPVGFGGSPHLQHGGGPVKGVVSKSVASALNETLETDGLRGVPREKTFDGLPESFEDADGMRLAEFSVSLFDPAALEVVLKPLLLEHSLAVGEKVDRLSKLRDGASDQSPDDLGARLEQGKASGEGISRKGIVEDGEVREPNAPLSAEHGDVDVPDVILPAGRRDGRVAGRFGWRFEASLSGPSANVLDGNVGGRAEEGAADLADIDAALGELIGKKRKGLIVATNRGGRLPCGLIGEEGLVPLSDRLLGDEELPGELGLGESVGGAVSEDVKGFIWRESSAFVGGEAFKSSSEASGLESEPRTGVVESVFDSGFEIGAATEDMLRGSCDGLGNESGGAKELRGEEALAERARSGFHWVWFRGLPAGVEMEAQHSCAVAGVARDPRSWWKSDRDPQVHEGR